MYYNHPAFIAANVDRLQTALLDFPADVRESVPVAFTAHSIPLEMARNSRYQAQLQETCRLVAEGAGIAPERWQLVYQSRSGSPRQPWLEPDILQHLHTLHGQQVTNLAVMPVGFISDHMEVLFDLDTEAQELAHELAIRLVRVPTVGTHPAFVSMIRELIIERMSDNPLRLALGQYPANHDVCPVDCCLPG